MFLLLLLLLGVLYSSEATGFRHLYYQPISSSSSSSFLSPVQLTSGDWQVETDGLWVDEVSFLPFLLPLFLSFSRSPSSYFSFLLPPLCFILCVVFFFTGKETDLFPG
jgi:hypothetical protein